MCEEEFAQARNLQVANALDPNWLQKSNFSVPPPYEAMEMLEIDEDDDVITLPETTYDDLDGDVCDSSSTPSPPQQQHRYSDKILRTPNFANLLFIPKFRNVFQNK